MKRWPVVRGFGLCLALAWTGAARSQLSTPPQPAGPAKATLADFAWVSGHWEGEVGDKPVEEFCSAPYHGLLMCMVRLADAGKTLGLEFISLQQKPDGIEERIRFYSPDLEEREPAAKPLVLHLARYSETEAVFENPNGSRPKSVTLIKESFDAMTSRIELTDEGGQTRILEARWRRLH